MSAPQLVSVPPGIILTGLYHHYDVGDARCYAGTGAVITDLMGNLTQGAGTTTFNGTPGGRSSGEFFSFSGGAWWSATPASGAFVRRLGRADTAFSIDGWVYMDSAYPQPMIDTKWAAAYNGFGWYPSYNGSHRHTFDRGLSSVTSSTIQILGGPQWRYFGISVDPVRQEQIIVQADASGLLTDTIPFVPVWSVGESPAQFWVGRYGDSYAGAGHRLAIWRLYNRALPLDDLRHNFFAQRGRFGI